MNKRCVTSSSIKLLGHFVIQRLYVLGSNEAQTEFRILKIHRTEPKSLVIEEDNGVYNAREINNIIGMADSGNRSKVRRETK